MCCDHHAFPTPFPSSSYRNIKDGDVVWVRSRNISQFAKAILPNVQNRFTLVTTYGTRSIPVECGLKDPEALISDERIAHWFTQNMKYEGRFEHKISPIPIGLDFHSQWEQGKSWRYDQRLTPLEQEDQILSIRKKAPPYSERYNQIYADFHFNNTTRKLKKRNPDIRYDRKEIFKLLKKNPAMVFQHKRLPRHRLWEKMAQYRFVISPHGEGLDCHRTWEALVLGCCVIVMRSSLDSLYKGLPVVIVDDFNEITLPKLNEWYEMHHHQLRRSTLNPRLTNDWWMDHICNLTQT